MTTGRGSREVAWQRHQERYTRRDERLAVIESSGAEAEPGGLAVRDEFAPELELEHTNVENEHYPPSPSG